MLRHDHVGNALVPADIMKALDAELLDEVPADLMGLGASAIRSGHAMVKHHHDAFGILHLSRSRQYAGKKFPS